MAKQVTTLNRCEILDATPTLQAITGAVAAGKTVVVEDLTITVEEACLLEVLTAGGARRGAWFAPAYGAAYLQNTKGELAGAQLQVRTSVDTRITVMVNYHVEG